MPKPTQFKIILPADVKAWLEAQAATNLRSQGAEIIMCIRAQMGATQPQPQPERADNVL